MDDVSLATPEIRLGDEHDCDAFVAIFNAMYPRTIDAAYFRWQFLVQEMRPFLIVATVGDELVGTLGGHFHDGRVGDVRVPLLHGLDLMFKQQHRRRGSFLPMVRYLFELGRRDKVPVAYGVFNTQAWLPVTRLLGFKRIVEIRTMVKEVRSQPPPTGNFHTERVSRFDDRDAAILAAFTRSHPDLMVVRRDPAFLNWRFVSSPVYRYDLLRVSRGPVALAYLVLKVFEDPASGRKVGDIVDLLWAEDDPDMLQDVLRLALAHFWALGVPQAAMWLHTNTILDDVGRGLGFAATGPTRHLLSRTLDPAGGWLEDPQRWFITMADAEIY